MLCLQCENAFKKGEEEAEELQMKIPWAFGFDFGFALKRQRSTTHLKPAWT